MLCVAVADRDRTHLCHRSEIPMFYWGLLIGVIVGANIGLILAGVLLGNKLRASVLLSE